MLTRHPSKHQHSVVVLGPTDYIAWGAHPSLQCEQVHQMNAGRLSLTKRLSHCLTLLQDQPHTQSCRRVHICLPAETGKISNFSLKHSDSLFQQHTQNSQVIAADKQAKHTVYTIYTWPSDTINSVQTTCQEYGYDLSQLLCWPINLYQWQVRQHPSLTLLAITERYALLIKHHNGQLIFAKSFPTSNLAETAWLSLILSELTSSCSHWQQHPLLLLCDSTDQHHHTAAFFSDADITLLPFPDQPQQWPFLC